MLAFKHCAGPPLGFSTAATRALLMHRCWLVLRHLHWPALRILTEYVTSHRHYLELSLCRGPYHVSLSLPPLLSLLLPSPFPSPSKLPTCALLSGITFVLATAPHHRTTLAGSPGGPLPPTGSLRHTGIQLPVYPLQAHLSPDLSLGPPTNTGAVGKFPFSWSV